MESAVLVSMPGVENICFLAMPCPSPATPRLHAIQNAVQRACNNNGFQLHGPIINHGSNIIDQIHSEIMASKIVFGILTDEESDNLYNPNVLYEVGLAHAVGKPVILIGDPSDPRFPFDLKFYPGIINMQPNQEPSQIEPQIGQHLLQIILERKTANDDLYIENRWGIKAMPAFACSWSQFLGEECDITRRSGSALCEGYMAHFHRVGRITLIAQTIFSPLLHPPAGFENSIKGRPETESYSVLDNQWSTLSPVLHNGSRKTSDFLGQADTWSGIDDSVAVLSKKAPKVGAAFNSLRESISMYKKQVEDVEKAVDEAYRSPSGTRTVAFGALVGKLANLNNTIGLVMSSSNQIMIELIELIAKIQGRR